MKRTSGYINIPFSLLLICAVMITGCNTLTSQESEKMYRIGFLAGADTFNVAMDGFQAGMADLGYVDGENISYEFQSANGDREKMKEIAQQYVTDGVDLIFTTTTGAAQEAQAATADSQTPVVFTIVSNPVGSGVVSDLRQPGANITGATRSLAGLISKRIEFLYEINPDLGGIWVPYEEGYANSPLTLEAIHVVADPLNINIIETPISSQDDLIADIERLSALDELEFSAIAISPDPTVQSNESMAAITAFAQERGLAVVANTLEQVRNGALLTYSDDTFESGQLAATSADKILQGAQPGEIPVAFVEPNLYLNNEVSQLLGYDIDESLLAQAKEIIQ